MEIQTRRPKNLDRIIKDFALKIAGAELGEDKSPRLARLNQLRYRQSGNQLLAEVFLREAGRGFSLIYSGEGNIRFGRIPRGTIFGEGALPEEKINFEIL